MILLYKLGTCDIIRSNAVNEYNISDSELIQNTAFKMGYTWGRRETREIRTDFYGVGDLYIIFNTLVKKIMYEVDEQLEEEDFVLSMQRIFNLDKNNVILFTNINGLLSFLKFGKKGPDYNTKKELVYESKILNFKQFIK